MPRTGQPPVRCTCRLRGESDPPGMLGTAAPVAQRIEQEPSNLLVAGSIPAGGTEDLELLRAAMALSERPARLAA